MGKDLSFAARDKVSIADNVKVTAIEAQPSKIKTVVEKPEVEAVPIVVQEVKPMAVMSKGKVMVEVIPRRDLPKVRIGKSLFCFRRGIRVNIPEEIIPHLKEKGII